MQRYRNIMVSFNLTDLDPTVAAYTAAVVRLTLPDHVDLVNVVDTRELPEEIALEYPTLVDAAVAGAGTAIRELMTKYDLQDAPRCSFRVQVVRGTPVEALVRHARTESTDLIIAGRDPQKERSGTLPERLSRQAPCSVLSVPKEAKPSFQNILVPVDFSPHSATALQHAVAIAQAAGAESVTCLHVYDVPGNYKKTGLSHSEFAAVMAKNVEQAWERFCGKVDPGDVELRPVFRRAAFPAQVIRDEAGKGEHDLVVMGARGKSAPKNLMLGSVSQRVINKTTVPLLVVKSKRDSTSLLNRLYDMMGDE